MLEDEAQKTISALTEDLKGLRTGRANPSLVENIAVEAYGSPMALKGVAAITAPDARTLAVEPWDAALVPAIVKAIENSSLGLRPVVDGVRIRLTIPPLTEERRRELTRLVSQRVEEGRIKLRKLREEERERINTEERAKNISEDEKFRRLKEIDKKTEEWQAKIDETKKRKEEELLA
jgi:ribosome recycling factor